MPTNHLQNQNRLERPGRHRTINKGIPKARLQAMAAISGQKNKLQLWVSYEQEVKGLSNTLELRKE
jgi:hypothetical protein